MKHLARCAPVQHPARPTVQEGLDMLDVTPRDLREVRALREELPDEAVGGLVGPALPGTVRVREEHTDPGLVREQRVLRHLFAAVVGQRPPQLLWQATHLAGKRPTDARGILRPQRHQERGARGPSPRVRSRNPAPRASRRALTER